MSEEILETTRRCYEELKKTAEILISENEKMRAETEKMRADIEWMRAQIMKQKNINKEFFGILYHKFHYKESPFDPPDPILKGLDKLATLI